VNGTIKKRVLVVDDSALMRRIISDIINSEESLEVAGIASNGLKAIEVFQKTNPDIVTMDIEMPEMDGIAALKEILKISNVPIIMVSAHTEIGSKKTLEAMSIGAVDFILKPAGHSDNEIQSFQEELIRRILTVVQANIVHIKHTEHKKHRFTSTRKKIVVIASSTGGPQTLEAFLSELPDNIPVPILVVQHMPPVFTKSLADRLNGSCQIEVREAVEGDELKNGVALIAPGDFHMELKADVEGYQGCIKLNQEPREQGVRPCANRLFRSVAPIFKENVIAIILTGMGSDGTKGAVSIKESNGTVISQSEKTCIIYGMPKSVADAGLSDVVVDLDKMAVALLQLLDI